jgi:hypothetical protein
LGQVNNIDDEKKRVDQELETKAAALAAAQNTRAALASLEKECSTAVVQASKYFVEKDLQILHSVITKTFQPEPGKVCKIIIPQKMGTLISFGESWSTG